jgi:hypothetical protein
MTSDLKKYLAQFQSLICNPSDSQQTINKYFKIAIPLIGSNIKKNICIRLIDLIGEFDLWQWGFAAAYSAFNNFKWDAGCTLKTHMNNQIIICFKELIGIYNDHNENYDNITHDPDGGINYSTTKLGKVYHVAIPEPDEADTAIMPDEVLDNILKYIMNKYDDKTTYIFKGIKSNRSQAAIARDLKLTPCRVSQIKTELYNDLRQNRGLFNI